MSYDVQIVADAVGPSGRRITTFALRYPRMIHSEFMTHRQFSRNASSTRAIPTARLIEWIENDPAMPVYWGKNQKGMQATEELTAEEQTRARVRWLVARDDAVYHARALMEMGVHKQIAGRILEPWSHINVVCTATGFDNFFRLRCDKNAMPEIQVLAVKMARAYRAHTPEVVPLGTWHLPFLTEEEIRVIPGLEGEPRFAAERRAVKLSVARCARVSYKTTDGKTPDPAADLALYESLLQNGHWSPFEHQAMAMHTAVYKSGNFAGWMQYRQTLPNGGVHVKFDFDRLDRFLDQDFTVA